MNYFNSIANFLLECVIANVPVTYVFLVQKENLPPLETNSPSFGVDTFPGNFHNTGNLSYRFNVNRNWATN